MADTFTCPSNSRFKGDIKGCGTEFEGNPDGEGIVDCPNCGLFFMVLCDTCQNSPHPGVLWPWMPNGDDSLPYVESCDDCNIYTSDEEAAKALAELIGSRVMWAEAPIESDGPGDALRPFVFAHPWSTVEQTVFVGLGGNLNSETAEPLYEKWLTERAARLELMKKEEVPVD